MVGYSRKSVAQYVTVLHTDRKDIWIEIGRVKIAGVYRKGDEGIKDIQEWVATTEKVARIRRRLAMYTTQIEASKQTETTEGANCGKQWYNWS